MRLHRNYIPAIALSLGLMTAGAFAAVDDERTELTINETIEVPGAMLEPGDYVLELLDSATDNEVVLVRDSDEELVTTLLAIPAERMEPTGDTVLKFYETPPGEPPALRLWFYPGLVNGHEFVYPETRGGEIAETAGRYVPTVSDEEYESFTRSGSSVDDDSEPMMMVVKEVSVYSLSPDKEQSEYDEGRDYNLERDRRYDDPGSYATARQPETSNRTSSGASRQTTTTDRRVRQRESTNRSSAGANSRLARQIRKEIVTLPFYSLWDHIEFRLDGEGNVELMGKVYRPSLKRSVERVVENVEGVQSVENNLDILPTSSQDDDIRRAAYRAIYGHQALQNYQLRAVPPIHIIVENGNITLEGVVNRQMEKNIAGVQANSVSGAFSVENNLRVENPRNQEEK